MYMIAAAEAAAVRFILRIVSNLMDLGACICSKKITSVIIISMVLFSLGISSFILNVYAQQGGAATSGGATGGAAISMGIAGGLNNCNQCTIIIAPQATGGEATSGAAIGGAAIGSRASGEVATEVSRLVDKGNVLYYL